VSGWWDGGLSGGRRMAGGGGSWGTTKGHQLQHTTPKILGLPDPFLPDDFTPTEMMMRAMTTMTGYIYYLISCFLLDTFNRKV